MTFLISNHSEMFSDKREAVKDSHKGYLKK